jgi:Mg/Co/Ni transporter MgtE
MLEGFKPERKLTVTELIVGLVFGVGLGAVTGGVLWLMGMEPPWVVLLPVPITTFLCVVAVYRWTVSQKM